MSTDKRNLITDKEFAIEMLCQTNEVWDRLSEELKNDPEVILYYQPMGGMMKVDTVDYGVEVKQATFFTEARFSYTEGMLVPAFAFKVPGFDLKKYIAIQEKMRDLATSREMTEEDSEIFSSKQGQNVGGVGENATSTTTIYSRIPLYEMAKIKSPAEIDNEVKNAGLITDEVTAIKLLTRTNKAWNLISPELKKSPRVVMAYQPTAILWNIFSDGQGLVCDGYVEPGFEVGQSSTTTFFVPTCAKEIPNFDYNAYMNLQGRIFPRKGHIYATREGLGEINNLFGKEPAYVDGRKGSEDVSVFWQLDIIDREALKHELSVENPEFDATTR